MIITDKLLEQFFLDNIDKASFIKEVKLKEKIIKILKEIIKIDEKIEKKERDPERLFDFIPKEQQEKIKNLHLLWEIFLKEAIFCLRKGDKDDKTHFKQDFGIIEIKKYFEDFSKFEDVLYGTIKYYRDHSLHVLRVFLFGFFLLNFKNPNGIGNAIHFKDINIAQKRDIKEIKIEIDEKVAIWTIIALTHDLGYPIEKIDRINEKIKNLLSYYGSSGIEELKYKLPLQNQNLNDFILKFISSKIIKKVNCYFTVIQNKYYLKFFKAFETFNHGIMSCILLMKHLVYFKESDYSHSFLSRLNERDAKQFLIRREILRAISSHDNDDIYHIYPNNFSFLLTFCDDLQEWNRPDISKRFEYTRDIKILDFNNKTISFEILFKISEEIKISMDHIEVFSKKVKRYIKLLRSGPDSDERPFSFIFSFTLTKKKETYKILEFKYPPGNEDPQIIINILNKNNVLTDFLKFIENNYEDRDKFMKHIIRKINDKLLENANQTKTEEINLKKAV